MFPSFALLNAYKKEEEYFKKTLKMVSISDVSQNSNVIYVHVIYRGKVNDDHTLKLKARIAPHANEDNQKGELKSDWAMCLFTSWCS